MNISLTSCGAVVVWCGSECSSKYNASAFDGSLIIIIIVGDGSLRGDEDLSSRKEKRRKKGKIPRSAITRAVCLNGARLACSICLLFSKKKS